MNAMMHHVMIFNLGIVTLFEREVPSNNGSPNEYLWPIS